ncbi:MAG: cytochrome c [Myxococcota bacterium]
MTKSTVAVGVSFGAFLLSTGCMGTTDGPSETTPVEPEHPSTRTPERPFDPEVDPPLTGEHGVLGCPTVETIPFTVGTASAQPTSESSGLSMGFATHCAACHGPEGEGNSLYPALPGALSEDEFVGVVRDGRGEAMPVFSPASISTDDLRADYRALIDPSREPSDPGELTDEWSWTDAEVAQARAEGLDLWRKPDPAGVACANCHTVDGFDVAIMGLPDHAIMRRGRLHLETEDVLKIVKFIHAQRRHFNIRKPCHPQYRPLQPGGTVLPGDSAAAQDLAFGQQLEAMGYRITTTVRTIEDAELAMQEVVETDLRNLRIGIALPRWTEDGFNGDPHATMNDHMPPIGFRPNAEHMDEWYGLSDAYIADPSDEHLVALVENFERMNNDGGYQETHSVRIQSCRRYTQAGDYLHDLSLRKRRGQFVTMHVMRRALLAGDETLDLSLAPLANALSEPSGGLNPFFSLAGEHAEAICYPNAPGGKEAGAAIIAAFPEAALAELPTTDMETGELRQLPRQIAHAWFTLGQVYDPALAMRQVDQGTNKLHYWQVLTFEHRSFHRPFFALHRLGTQEHYRAVAAQEGYPDTGHFVSGATSPLLDATNLFTRELVVRYDDEDEPSAGKARRLLGNVMRTLLLLQIQRLGDGASWDNGTNSGVTRQNEDFRTWANNLVRHVDRNPDSPIANELGTDLPLYTTGLIERIDEMEQLLAAAPEIRD